MNIRNATDGADEMVALSLTRMLGATADANPSAAEETMTMLWLYVLERWVTKVSVPDDPAVRSVLIMLSAYFDTHGDWGKMEALIRQDVPQHPLVDRTLDEVDRRVRALPRGASRRDVLAEVIKVYFQVMAGNP